MAIWQMDISGLDEPALRYMRDPKKITPTIDKMLKAGAAVMQEELRQEIKQTFTKRPTGDLAKSIRPGRIKHTSTTATIEIKPVGNNKHKQSRARIGTVLNYGRRAYKSGRGAIEATHWVEKVHARAEDKIRETMMEVWVGSGL